MATQGLGLAVADAADRARLADWAAEEGWNPGPQDMDCLAAQDPRGFFVGRLDGEPVSGISLVNYGDGFAFLGFYLVRPRARGRGIGLATWQGALPHAGRRVIGLDGVVAQQANYARSGFALAHRNVRYGGSARPAAAPAPGIVALDAVPAAALDACDAAVFPAPRPAFLAAWTRAPGHVGRALLRDGDLAGFGVARPCREGVKIGPLTAATRADAEALLDALLLATPAAAAGPVFLDVPEPNAAAVALAEARGLTPRFETARMYTGPIRPLRLERIFGIASFELG